MSRTGAPPHFASATALALGKTSSVAPSLDCAPCHLLPDGGNQPADPPSSPLNVPTNSRQPSPRRALLAHRLSNYVRHSHGRPPSSCRCAYLTPPLSPSIGIWLGPFAFPYPSSMVSTTRTSRFGGFGFSKVPGGGVTRTGWHEDSHRVILIGIATNPNEEDSGDQAEHGLIGTTTQAWHGR